MEVPLLKVQEAKKYFPVSKGLLFMKVVGWVKAVDDVTCHVQKGGTLGLVGESGCGKTTLAKLILRLEQPTGGSIIFEGKDIHKLSHEEYKRYRTAVQAVFQDPFTSLNPRMRIGSILAEPLEVNSSLSRSAIKERVDRVLVQVGLSAASANLFPHEFSGGQRQRVAVARALAADAKLIVLDEPVSALDVSIRAQIMNLLRDLQQNLGVAYLLIAHSLATIRHMSTDVVIMYLGKIVEDAPSEELYTNPLHPYTKALLSAALPSHPRAVKTEIVLTGEVPSAFNPPPGCHFHPRCPQILPVCSEVEPILTEVAPGHRVSCHLYPRA